VTIQLIIGQLIHDERSYTMTIAECCDRIALLLLYMFENCTPGSHDWGAGSDGAGERGYPLYP